MPHVDTTLLIPIELQVRELDPKLLLACRAALRGFKAVIGPRREMHFYIPFFTNGIYMSKSITVGSTSVFRMLQEMGHRIVAWDEEALVHMPPAAYFKSRINDQALKFVSALFAWGQDNVELWRQFDALPPSLPIHITGNPRGDLLRPGIREIYQDDANGLRERYGRFILINTNFNQVNAFSPQMNYLVPSSQGDKCLVLGRRALAMGVSLPYAEGLCAHKHALFEDFKALIPAVAEQFPEYTIVVRPHPAEQTQVYEAIADRCQRVEVINEGNVVPWLMASRALIHNGCTTGVEAFALGVPVIAYRSQVNEGYDRDFHHLPNLISRQCFSFDELKSTLRAVLTDTKADATRGDRQALMDQFLAAQDGPLAADRMLDVLEEMVQTHPVEGTVTMRQRAKGFYRVTKRRIKKTIRGFKADMAHNRSGFLRHRYPGISWETINDRIARIKQVLGVASDLRINKIHRHFFEIKLR